jgi:ABC-type nitrate/sulfonate/bicarbonate transport system permease component
MKKILLIFLLPILYTIFSINNPTHVYLPTSSELVTTFLKLFSEQAIYKDIFASLQRVVIGFILASIIGVACGILLGIHTRLQNIKIYIDILRPIPPIAWIPIAIMFFGLGNTSAYFIVFLGSFFPIFTNTYFGVITMPTIYKNVSLSFELSKVTYYRKVVGMYSLPFIFSGLKMGMGMAWMSVIAAELIGAQSGLGYFIQQSRLLLQTENVIIGMILIGCIGYVLQKTMEKIENKLIPWKNTI